MRHLEAKERCRRYLMDCVLSLVRRRRQTGWLPCSLTKNSPRCWCRSGTPGRRCRPRSWKCSPCRRGRRWSSRRRRSPGAGRTWEETRRRKEEMLTKDGQNAEKGCKATRTARPRKAESRRRWTMQGGGRGAGRRKQLNGAQPSIGSCLFAGHMCTTTHCKLTGYRPVLGVNWSAPHPTEVTKLPMAGTSVASAAGWNLE